MVHLELKAINSIRDDVTALIMALSNGLKKAECDVTVGDDAPIASISAYWVGDLIRIDIKFPS
jgi:hypothetical protein